MPKTTRPPAPHTFCTIAANSSGLRVSRLLAAAISTPPGLPAWRIAHCSIARDSMQTLWVDMTSTKMLASAPPSEAAILPQSCSCPENLLSTLPWPELCDAAGSGSVPVCTWRVGAGLHAQYGR